MAIEIFFRTEANIRQCFWRPAITTTVSSRPILLSSSQSCNTLWGRRLDRWVLKYMLWRNFKKIRKPLGKGILIIAVKSNTPIYISHLQTVATWVGEGVRTSTILTAKIGCSKAYSTFFSSYFALITVNVVPSPSTEHNDELKSEKILVLVFKKIRMIKT